MFKNLWLNFLDILVKAILSLRYRIEVKGLETIKPGKNGALFLPNHPAEIDPIILVAILWKKFKVHPLVVERFYYLSGAHYFEKLVGSVPIPELDTVVNKWKQKKIEKTFNYIKQQLKAGENFLIYPSGKLKLTPQEVIGGASFVHQLVQECPDTPVVLIRTTGLWGSRFSCALTGGAADFGKVLWEGFKILLKNGIFFTPRRLVTVEIEPAPADLPIQGKRIQFNQFLEKWYNLRGPEPLKLVSDAFWKESYPQIVTKREKKTTEEKWKLDGEVEKEIIEKIKQISRRNVVERSHNLTTDLGLDSLDIAALHTFLEERFDLERIPPGELETVEDVLKAAANGVKESQAESETPPTKWAAKWPPKWSEEPMRPPPFPPQGKTLQEAILKSCARMDYFSACADEILGVVTYRRFKLLSLILSRRISRLEGDHIGILLPSSTMAYILIFATLLAKKIPVMLNWTVGSRAIDHCIKVSELKVILSSRRFLDNLPGADLGSADEKLLLLEDLRSSITLLDRFHGILGFFKEIEPCAVSEDDPAVILFTSGTESLPKGVPLSHKNLLSNQTAAMESITLVASDVLYGILPPFHSFGFSVTGILPLLTGIKTYYAPDPTHYRGLARDIAASRATLFFCAPTFIRGVFRVAKPNQLKSLRYVVGGAEKVPEELFEKVKEIGGEMLEGYGVTECGPVVTLTRPGKPRIGVGQPLPGVELLIIDPETNQQLQTGQDGEICISGPNVFKGYLDIPKSPFIELEGKKWYKSGDRGHLEPDGSLVLTGRLKRFVKIGGEMVSLGGLEEELLRLAKEKGWVKEIKPEIPPLAVAASEKESEKTQVIVFTTFDVRKEEINEALRQSGYGRLIKVAEVRKIEQIPLTGTGKVQYQALDEMLEQR